MEGQKPTQSFVIDFRETQRLKSWILNSMDINQLSSQDIISLAPSLLGNEDTVIACLQRIFEMLLTHTLQAKVVAHVLSTNVTPSLSTTKMVRICFAATHNKVVGLS